MLLLMTVIVIGCSGNSKQDSGGNEVSLPTNTGTNKSTPADVGTNKAEEDDGAKVSVSVGDTGKNMKLPDNFPKDVVPLLDDADIVNINNSGGGTAIGIIFKTNKSYNEAVAFYQDVMKSGTVTVENKTEDAYLLIGNKDKYGITITINKYSEKDISVLINVSF